jgi:hypothetical protein
MGLLTMVPKSHPISLRVNSPKIHPCICPVHLCSRRGVNGMHLLIITNSSSKLPKKLGARHDESKWLSLASLVTFTLNNAIFLGNASLSHLEAL